MCVCVYTLVYQEEMFLERSEMSARVAGMVFIFLVVEFFFYQVFVLFFFFCLMRNLELKDDNI